MNETTKFLAIPLAHHDGSELYVDNPQPELGDAVRLSVRCSNTLRLTAVYVRAVVDGEPRYTQANRTTIEKEETWWQATVTMVNPITTYRFLLIAGEKTIWLNGTGLHEHNIPDAADFRLTTFHTPRWVEDAVIYQIFPDRFARSQNHQITHYPQWAIPAAWDTDIADNTPDGVRQVYGGSLWGVAEHLDYIKRLGANTLYLTPFFPAQSNHRYDASTFDTVDPLLGGDAALRTLITKAHKLGMHVIGDLTLNHSGVTHDWFERGRTNPDSAEAGFYFFNRKNHDDVSYATFDGVQTLPKFDHRSKELQRRLYCGPDSVVARYIENFDLDGWRIDVAQSAGKYHAVDMNDFIAKQTRMTMNQVRNDTLLIAEHQFDASATLQGDGWQGTMAYAGFTKPVWSWLTNLRSNAWGVPGPAEHYGAQTMTQTMAEFSALMPWQSYVTSMTLLDSHDTARFRSVSGRFQALGIALLFTLPGIPTIFSGDEVGVEGHNLEAARQPFPWRQSEQDGEILHLYRRLIALRHSHSALHRGGLRWLNRTDDTVLFERADSTERILVSISRSDHPALISTINAESLLGGPDLVKGKEMPSTGPAFHIWRVTE